MRELILQLDETIEGWLAFGSAELPGVDAVLDWYNITPQFVGVGIIALFALGVAISTFRLVLGLVNGFASGRFIAALVRMFASLRMLVLAIPGLMISLGIFGTFYGIYVALEPLDFSPDKMNDSVQALLDGMKTAFASSLLGLGGAVAYKIIATVSEFATQAATSVKKEQPNEDVIAAVDAVRQAIASQGDSSLTSQIRELRQQNSSEFGKLNSLAETIHKSLDDGMRNLHEETKAGHQKLDGLTETIRDSLVKNMEKLITDLRDIIAKQLGDQLQDLIKNIQDALIEQFGKTFVQFNEAVQALKKWQEDHRRHVEQLTAAFDETAKGIEQIRADCAQIPATMEQLRNTVGTVNAQVADLDARLSAFAEMKQQAEQSFPVIKEHLDKIGTDLSNSAQGFHQMEATINQSVNTITENLKSHIAETNDGLRQHLNATSEEFKSQIQQMTGELQSAATQSQSAINATSAAFDTQVKEMTTAMRSAMEQSQTEVNNKVEETLGGIKQSMDKLNEELNKSAKGFDSMGVAMNQTVNDVAESMKTQIARSNADLRTHYSDTSEEFKAHMEQMTSAMRSNLEQTQKDFNAKIEESLGKLENGIASELERIAQEYGQNMIAIARECADAINQVNSGNKQ